MLGTSPFAPITIFSRALPTIFSKHIELCSIIVLCRLVYAFYFAYYPILQFLKISPIILHNMPIIPLLLSLVTHIYLQASGWPMKQQP